MKGKNREICRRNFFKAGITGIGGILTARLFEDYLSGSDLFAQYRHDLSGKSYNYSGPCVLDEPEIPIVGWAGPSGDMIRDDVMRGMAESGFTISHSSTSTEEAEAALDIAHRNGVRLILSLPDTHVGNNEFLLDEGRKRRLKELVARIKDHPGLYGYYLRDEPNFDLLDRISEFADFIRSMDTYHMCYINHFPPNRQDGFGAGSMELFWRYYIEKLKPRFLSYDHYCIQIAADEQLKELGSSAPNVYGKIVVKPDYFEALDFVRNLSIYYGLHMWGFTNCIRHGAYPTSTEGHIRYQLMCNLAYGCTGLQYFTYAHGESLVRRDGSTTPTWDIAKLVNTNVRLMWTKMNKLQSIGVYHTGPVWGGTRMLKPSDRPNTVSCKGDPAVLGFFKDSNETFFVLVVNKNPVEWARMTLQVNLKEGENLYYFDLVDKQMQRPWPYNPKEQMVLLAPGEGILYQLGGKG